ncbi:MAG: lipopolysaccharide heptosyltransferase II [Candidatus Omnitrophota bacterium]
MGKLSDRKRILIVNVNWLGDVLFSTPAIRGIRKAYPDVFIASMIVPRVEEVLTENPNLNELIIFDEEGEYQKIKAKLRFAALLEEKKFDSVFLFHRSFTRTMVTYIAGIPERIGYGTIKRAFLLTHKISPPKIPMHRVDYISNIANSVGIETDNTYCDFYISQEDREYAQKFLIDMGISNKDIVIVLNPGGNWLPKRWPLGNFARLADVLIKEFDLKVIISGAKSDLPLADEITQMMTQKPIIACGELSLKQSAALFEKSTIVVSADTSPLHIAAAVGARVIGLFGPTSPEITGPRGKGHIKIIQKDTNCKIPCYDQECSDYRCMKAISARDVLEEIYKVIKP